MNKYVTGVYFIEAQLKPLWSKAIASLSTGVLDKLTKAATSAQQEEEHHHNNDTCGNKT